MQVVDLDGHWSNWSVSGNISKGSVSNKSSLHILAREIIKDIYPTMQLLEEVTIHVRKTEVSYLDFYIPLIKKCVEVHGEQHYSYTPFYHTSKLAFLKAQKKDREKKEWCELNGIKLIELPFNQQKQWKDIITND